MIRIKSVICQFVIWCLAEEYCRADSSIFILPDGNLQLNCALSWRFFTALNRVALAECKSSLHFVEIQSPFEFVNAFANANSRRTLSKRGKSKIQLSLPEAVQSIDVVGKKKKKKNRER